MSRHFRHTSNSSSLFSPPHALHTRSSHGDLNRQITPRLNKQRPQLKYIRIHQYGHAAATLAPSRFRCISEGLCFTFSGLTRTCVVPHFPTSCTSMSALGGKYGASLPHQASRLFFYRHGFIPNTVLVAFVQLRSRHLQAVIVLGRCVYHSGIVRRSRS